MDFTQIGEGLLGYIQKRRGVTPWILWTTKTEKKISYDEAAYILTGEAEPFVTPRPNLGPWYHRKFGDYLNVLDAQKHCLFTVRYSQENLNLLMEKCIHAQLMDIQTYRAKEKNH